MKKFLIFVSTLVVVLAIVALISLEIHSPPQNQKSTGHTTNLKIRSVLPVTGAASPTSASATFTSSVSPETLLDGKWVKYRGRIVDFIDSGIYRFLSPFDPDFAGVLTDPFVSFVSEKFDTIYSSYRKYIDNRSDDEVNKMLHSEAHHVFENLPQLIIKYERGVLAKKFSYYFLKDAFSRVNRNGIKLIFLLVRRYDPKILQLKFNKMYEGREIYQNQKILMKVPYLSISSAYKIEVYFIAKELSYFFEENSIKK